MTFRAVLLEALAVTAEFAAVLVIIAGIGAMAVGFAP